MKPVYEYRCSECNSLMTQNVQGNPPNASLGTFRCPKHGKVKTVRVRKQKPAEEVSA